MTEIFTQQRPDEFDDETLTTINSFFENNPDKSWMNRYEEKKLDLKKAVNEKMFIAHIENADYKINKALEDAGNEINNVLDGVDEEFAEAVKPLELILYKADNRFEEIFLNSQLKMQKAKNELITNLENDIDRAIELSNIEQDLDDVRDKIDTVVVTLEGKIQSDKEELKQKYKK